MRIADKCETDLFFSWMRSQGWRLATQGYPVVTTGGEPGPVPGLADGEYFHATALEMRLARAWADAGSKPGWLGPFNNQ